MLGDTSREACDQAAYYTDLDGDGFGGALSECGDPDAVFVGGDCNDGNDLVNPDAAETCNETDDNCDDTIDEGLTATTWYADGDDDGHGEIGAGEDLCADPGAGFSTLGDDCADDDPEVFPGAVELCDGIDNSCIGAPDGHVATWFGTDGTITDVSGSTGELALTGDGELALCEGLWSFRPSVQPSANVSIRGSGDATLDAQSAGTAVTIGANAIVQVDDIEILGGSSTSNGGNIAIDGGASVTLTNVVVTGGSATLRGGGVHMASGSSLVITGGSFGANDAGEGGGLYADATATLSATDTLFSTNNANEGGAVFTGTGSSTLSNCTFQDNTAAAGAGIAAAGGTVTLVGGLFQRNVATGNGGGINLAEGAHLDSDGTDFVDNAAAEGGALYGTSSVLSLLGGSITGGSADLRGAGVSVVSSKLFLTSVTLDSNSATQGGAVAVVDGELTVEGSTFSNNSATDYAGAMHVEGSVADISGCEFSNNTAVTFGGAIGLNGVEARLNSSLVGGNTAGEGGGIYVITSTVTLAETTLTSNSADNGGALEMADSTVTITGGGGSSVDGNRASDLGGAFFVVGDRRTTTNLSLSGVDILGNAAAGGAGVDVSGQANLVIAGGTLFSGGNLASEHGGGLSLGKLGDLYSGTATCSDSTFDDNDPEDVYAALSLTGGTFTGSNCTLSTLDLAGSGSQGVSGDFSCDFSGCL